MLFLMAGGGTGGHVIPALAVAEELAKRGHQVLFFGTKAGMEARLVPQAGYQIEWIDIGGLKRVGWRQTLRTAWQLPASVLRVWRRIGPLRAAAAFSMGGYVAGPVVVGAWIRRIPIVAMEPNAMPGMTNRIAGRLYHRVLLAHAEAARYFAAGRTEVSGYPVRDEFFHVPEKQPEDELVVLITGGSQGARRLNEAFEESWPLFRESGLRVRFLHQSGRSMHAAMQAGFAESGLPGEVAAFVDDMPAAFTAADVVVCRSGAGAVAELTAAGKPSILVPFPFAADDHQLRNAQALERAGAARLVRDGEMSGVRLFTEISALARDRKRLTEMGLCARGLARPGSARRAADVLEEAAGAA